MEYDHGEQGLSTWVHKSQFLTTHQKSLRDSLINKQIAPKFHYLSYRQSQRWSKLHKAYSPVAIHSEGKRLYEKAFDYVTKLLADQECVEVTSLGCGAGNKDMILLEALLRTGNHISYLPSDISLPLVTQASLEANKLSRCKVLRGSIGDFLQAEDLNALVGQRKKDKSRVFLFLGMIPNMSPAHALAKLSHGLELGDILIISANLLGDQMDEHGLITQYDNPETKHWLECFWDDLDVPEDTWNWEFNLCNAAVQGINYLRVEVNALFNDDLDINYERNVIKVEARESVRTFFSNRFSSEAFTELVEKHSFKVKHVELLPDQSEGVWVLAKD
ncbi:MAG: L-histidine N(alpha)-methyltransferase [Verrucomicrobiota bacterium]